jgi:hypothetical protein
VSEALRKFLGGDSINFCGVAISNDVKMLEYYGMQPFRGRGWPPEDDPEPDDQLSSVVVCFVQPLHWDKACEEGSRFHQRQLLRVFIALWSYLVCRSSWFSLRRKKLCTNDLSRLRTHTHARQWLALASLRARMARSRCIVPQDHRTTDTDISKVPQSMMACVDIQPIHSSYK